MKEILYIIGTIIVAAVIGVIIVAVIKESGYKNGYKQGQIDALNGKIKYKIDTTKVINYIEIK
jgi:hypothetical protein